MINISFLEVPLSDSMKDNTPLNDKMFLTAKPLYKSKTIPFENLHRIVKSDFRQYSPFEFKDGLKKSENWNNDNQNLLILDVDDGLTIQQAKEKFKNYQYFICTTKSHQVEKKGLKCDRFRVILYSEDIPKGDKYFEFTKALEEKYPFIDKQVNTKTGAFLGYSDCEYWYNNGKYFKCSELTKKIDKKEEIKKAFSPIQKQMPKENFQNELPINEIKNRLTRETIADIVSSRGFEVNRKFMFKVRDERTPSCSISKDGVIVDFGGERYGDIFRFLEIESKMNFREAVEYVQSYV
jgi:hypothetical protein